MKTVACDVLVADSGIAGFTAALKLHSQGSDVLMVEKELFGGTSAFSAGMPWVPANPAAKAKGDTAEKALRDFGDKLDASLKSSIEKQIEAVRKAKETKDANKVRSAVN